MQRGNILYLGVKKECEGEAVSRQYKREKERDREKTNNDQHNIIKWRRKMEIKSLDIFTNIQGKEKTELVKIVIQKKSEQSNNRYEE